MKVLLRHIFSFLLFIISVAVSAQNPDEPKRSESDTLKVSTESLNIKTDTLISENDTLKVSNDIIRVPVDTVRIPSDSLQIKQDTVNVNVDQLYLQDSVLIPSDSAQIKKLDAADTIPRNTRQVLDLPKLIVSEPQESIQQPKDTVIGPSGFEVFIDYGKLLTIPSEFETKAEAGVSYTSREKLMILIELGYGKISPEEAIKNGNYTSEGFYARAGAAYGGEILPKSYVYLGLMYGTSRFDDSGNVQIESQVSEDLNQPFSRTDLEASWIEFVIISETEIRNNIFLGSKWRLRFLGNFDYDYDPIVYAIPGYGRSFDNSIPAVNLYIKYRF